MRGEFLRTRAHTITRTHARAHARTHARIRTRTHCPMYAGQPAAQSTLTPMPKQLCKCTTRTCTHTGAHACAHTSSAPDLDADVPPSTTTGRHTEESGQTDSDCRHTCGKRRGTFATIVLLRKHRRPGYERHNKSDAGLRSDMRWSCPRPKKMSHTAYGRRMVPRGVRGGTGMAMGRCSSVLDWARTTAPRMHLRLVNWRALWLERCRRMQNSCQQL
jgi:hypothetical protein